MLLGMLKGMCWQNLFFFFFFISGGNTLPFLFCLRIKFHLFISLQGKTHAYHRSDLAVLPPCWVRREPGCVTQKDESLTGMGCPPTG